MEHPVILFDGVCNYCNAVCNFIIRHDPAGRFRFAPLQSAIGQALLEKYRLSKEALDTVVLIEDDAAYTKSDVTVRVAPHLTGVARLGTLLKLVPSAIRNAGYDLISRNRYAWWGKHDTCIVPSPDVRDRFLS